MSSKAKFWLPLLLIPGCLAPKFEIVPSFDDGGTGGTGASGGADAGKAGTATGGTKGGTSSGPGGTAGDAGDGAIIGGEPGTGATAGSAGAPVGGSTGNGGSAGSGGSAGPLFKNYEYTGSWPNQPIAFTTQAGTLTYTKYEVNSRFLAESCSIADYNGDGHPDVSSGRRWYEGPAFTTEHVFRDGHDDLPRAGASPEIDTGEPDDIADFPFDMDGDGDADIINIANPDTADSKNPTPMPAPQPHASAYWYRNPGTGAAADAKWESHLIHADVRLEEHGLVDVDGDGKPEFYGACKACTPNQTKGYYQGDWSNPTAAWTYHAVTKLYTFPFGGTGFLHGEGFGDVNGDGKPDLLERGGAWIDALATAPNTTACPAAGCGWFNTTFYDGDAGDNRGPSQMYATDVDGDGDADVIAADWAHGWGLAWYEQTSAGVFVRRQFMGSNTAADIAAYGTVYFSEPHALQVADMDGDGVPDVVTGKMRFANPLSYGDPDPNGAPLLVVFKGKRNTPSAANGGSVTFEPHVIDQLTGVGRQIAVGHLNDDGIMDICVASKVGLYVFLGH